MSSYKAIRRRNDVEKIAGWKEDPVRAQHINISGIVVPFFRFSRFIERGKDGSILDEIERNKLKSILKKEMLRFKKTKILF